MKGLKAFYLLKAFTSGCLTPTPGRQDINMSSPIYRPKRKKFKGWQRAARGGR